MKLESVILDMFNIGFDKKEIREIIIDILKSIPFDHSPEPKKE